jgi:hypothetical protein
MNANLKATLLSNYTRRLNTLPQTRQAAIAEALKLDSMVVLSYDPGTGTTIGTLTGEQRDRLWHLELTQAEASAIGDALVDFLNEQDINLKAAVSAILEAGGRLMLAMTLSSADPELRVLLAVDGKVYPLAAYIDNVATIH